MNLIKKKQLFHYSFLIKKKGAVYKKKKKTSFLETELSNKKCNYSKIN